jgi:hypothetical protein
MSFISDYTDLIITQYFNKPKASAEIALQAGTWETVFDFLKSFQVEFDIDNATGDRLDKIGKIVGISRIVPFVIDKIRFGFDGDDSARGFADVFNPAVASAPFFDISESEFTSQQLDDFDYRIFIQAKISSNSASAFMVSDDRTSIQDVVNLAFDGQAFVVDNLNMSLTIFVSNSVDTERILLIDGLGLLPKPQGVRYSIVQFEEDIDSFGFLDDPFALGFGDAFDLNIGGTFAEFTFIA